MEDLLPWGCRLNSEDMLPWARGSDPGTSWWLQFWLGMWVFSGALTLRPSTKHQARCLSIRPSVHFLPLIRLKVARGLEPIPAAIGWEVGYILDIRSVTGLKQNARKPTTHYRIHAYNQFRIVSEPNPFMWDSGRKPEYLEGTQERGKHANSTRKGPRPLGCEATVLATDPPC